MTFDRNVEENLAKARAKRSQAGEAAATLNKVLYVEVGNVTPEAAEAFVAEKMAEHKSKMTDQEVALAAVYETVAIERKADFVAGLEAATSKTTIDALVAEITPENVHAETETGAAVGNEFPAITGSFSPEALEALAAVATPAPAPAPAPEHPKKKSHKKH